MLNIVFLSIVIILVFLFSGIPATALTFLNTRNTNRINFVTFIAISLVVGSGISAFSIACAYGFLGIDNYLLVLSVISILLWILVIKYKSNIMRPISDIKSLYYLIPSLVVSLYLIKSQWDKSFNPIIRAGVGTDTSQNLMAAQVANQLGNTWASTTENLVRSLGVENIHQAANDIFRIPSFKEVAGYDYLVYGGRWGLTILYNQIIRFFGPQAVMWEIGVILFTTLISLSIIFFACIKQITKSNILSSFITLAMICNSGFLYLYFNGGVSQAFGTIGVSGILLVLVLMNESSDFLENKIKRSGVFILASTSWLMSAITYVDATFVLILLMLLLTILFYFKNKKFFKNMFSLVLLPGLVSAILVPNFIHSIFVNLTYRAAANTGTGTTTGIWKTPSQLIGFFNVFKLAGDTQSNFTFYISVFISILIAFFILKQFVKNIPDNSMFTCLGISTIIIILIGLTLSLNGREKSDYIYNKITIYVAPFIIFSVFVLLAKNLSRKTTDIYKLSVISILTIVIVGSSFLFENEFANSPYATVIPSEYSKLLQDKKIAEYLKSKNYLQPYKAAYNFTGLVGAEYWISKAPNDMKLDSRIDNELAVLCFYGDAGCVPKTESIPNPDLNKYGILEFKSLLSTRDFATLSIQERFNYSFDSVGLPRMEVPLKFQGGNPYLK